MIFLCIFFYLIAFVSHEIFSCIKSTGKKRVSFERLCDEKPMLGLRYLAYILQHPYNKKVILRKNLTQVKT